jgi:hypothetical protein
MKLSTYNPHIMKKAIVPAPFFSAYPLKALNLPEQEKKSYLHIITNATGKDKEKKKYAEKENVFPMHNVYNEKGIPVVVNRPLSQTTTDHIEEKDSDWFASYE